MTTVLVSGDSWTSGWPLEEDLKTRDFSWPSLASRRLGYRLRDKSRAGSSNARIYRKAFDGLLDPEIDMCWVWLTHWARVETGHTNSGRIWQHIPVQKESQELFTQWFHPYLNYSNMLRQIISLQSLACAVKKPIWFLDTVKNNLIWDMDLDKFKDLLRSSPDVFDAMDDERIEQKLSIVQNLTKAIDTSHFMGLESYQSIVAGLAQDRGHPMQDAHRKMADHVVHWLSTHA